MNVTLTERAQVGHTINCANDLAVSALKREAAGHMGALLSAIHSTSFKPVSLFAYLLKAKLEAIEVLETMRPILDARIWRD